MREAREEGVEGHPRCHRIRLSLAWVAHADVQLIASLESQPAAAKKGQAVEPKDVV